MGPDPRLAGCFLTSSRVHCSQRISIISRDLGLVAEQATTPKEVKRVANALTSNTRLEIESRNSLTIIHGCENNVRNPQTVRADGNHAASHRLLSDKARAMPVTVAKQARKSTLSAHRHWAPLDLDLDRHVPPCDSGCHCQHGRWREGEA